MLIAIDIGTNGVKKQQLKNGLLDKIYLIQSVGDNLNDDQKARIKLLLDDLNELQNQLDRIENMKAIINELKKAQVVAPIKPNWSNW